MEKEVLSGLKETAAGKLNEPPRKQITRLQIPFLLRFALIWTAVFGILGIIIQSISGRQFVFVDFFISNYGEWFRGFGSFIQATEYESGMAIFKSIMAGWYYFFYTGGLISLIWGIVSWIVHAEIVIKRKDKPSVIPVNTKLIPISQQEVIREQKEKLEDWLEEGLRLLAEGNLEEAELIYKSIRTEYNPEQDLERRNYRRILDFYIEIMEEKKALSEKGSKK